MHAGYIPYLQAARRVKGALHHCGCSALEGLRHRLLINEIPSRPQQRSSCSGTPPGGWRAGRTSASESSGLSGAETRPLDMRACGIAPPPPVWMTCAVADGTLRTPRSDTV